MERAPEPRRRVPTVAPAPSTVPQRPSVGLPAARATRIGPVPGSMGSDGNQIRHQRPVPSAMIQPMYPGQISPMHQSPYMHQRPATSLQNEAAARAMRMGQVPVSVGNEGVNIRMRQQQQRPQASEMIQPMYQVQSPNPMGQYIQQMSAVQREAAATRAMRMGQVPVSVGSDAANMQLQQQRSQVPLEMMQQMYQCGNPMGQYMLPPAGPQYSSQSLFGPSQMLPRAPHPGYQTGPVTHSGTMMGRPAVRRAPMSVSASPARPERSTTPGLARTLPHTPPPQVRDPSRTICTYNPPEPLEIRAVPDEEVVDLDDDENDDEPLLSASPAREPVPEPEIEEIMFGFEDKHFDINATPPDSSDSDGSLPEEIVRAAYNVLKHVGSNDPLIEYTMAETYDTDSESEETSQNRPPTMYTIAGFQGPNVIFKEIPPKEDAEGAVVKDEPEDYDDSTASIQEKAIVSLPSAVTAAAIDGDEIIIATENNGSGEGNSIIPGKGELDRNLPMVTSVKEEFEFEDHGYPTVRDDEASKDCSAGTGMEGEVSVKDETNDDFAMDTEKEGHGEVDLAVSVKDETNDDDFAMDTEKEGHREVDLPVFVKDENSDGFAMDTEKEGHGEVDLAVSVKDETNDDFVTSIAQSQVKEEEEFLMETAGYSELYSTNVGQEIYLTEMVKDEDNEENAMDPVIEEEALIAVKEEAVEMGELPWVPMKVKEEDDDEIVFTTTVKIEEEEAGESTTATVTIKEETFESTTTTTSVDKNVVKDDPKRKRKRQAPKKAVKKIPSVNLETEAAGSMGNFTVSRALAKPSTIADPLVKNLRMILVGSPTIARALRAGLLQTCSWLKPQNTTFLKPTDVSANLAKNSEALAHIVYLVNADQFVDMSQVVDEVIAVRQAAPQKPMKALVFVNKFTNSKMYNFDLLNMFDYIEEVGVSTEMVSFDITGGVKDLCEDLLQWWIPEYSASSSLCVLPF